MMCLEGTTPVAMRKVHVLWRTAFQAAPLLLPPSGHCVPGYRRYALYCLPGSTIATASYTLDKDKNHEKHLASFEAQGHAAGLNAEPASLTARAHP